MSDVLDSVPEPPESLGWLLFCKCPPGPPADGSGWPQWTPSDITDALQDSAEWHEAGALWLVWAAKKLHPGSREDVMRLVRELRAGV